MGDLESKIQAAYKRYLEAKSEEDVSEAVAEIVRISPDPNVYTYIFQSNDYLMGEYELDIKKLIEKINEYKPILL